MKPRRIGVLGTFVWDTIHHPDGERGLPIEQRGGLAYSLCGFAAACPAGWEVVPIARVGRDLADAAATFMTGLPNLTPGLVDVVDEPNNRVELRYADRAERTERLTGGVPPWSWEGLRARLDGLDALYVNYLSGYEMGLETAARVRAEFTGPIYADLHSLFLDEPAGERPRAPRRLSDWERWVGTAEVVQMNEVELGLLGDRGLDPATVLASAGKRAPAAVLVTRGAGGASYALREHAGVQPWIPAFAGMTAEGAGRTEGTTGRTEGEEERTQDGAGGTTGGVGWAGGPRGEVPVPDAPLAGDPTGCGDIWGSVTFCGLLEGMELPAAMRRGHVAAAARLVHGRISGLDAAIESALTSYARTR